MIGESCWPQSSLAKALLEKKGRQEDQYHGMQCISQLCSGDVASLLMIYSTIFSEASVTRSTTEKVASHVQHRAIVRVSRKLLEVVRTYYPHGPQMYEVVTAFGTLVRNILEHGRIQKNGRRRGGELRLTSMNCLSLNPSKSLRRTLRGNSFVCALFIEMEPGLSRHGNVTTLRWQFRRIFLPAFGCIGEE